jgi:surface-anchored protein
MFRPSRLAALFAAVLATLLANVSSAHAIASCLDHGHVDGAWISIAGGNLQLQINDHGGSGIGGPTGVTLKAKPASKQVVANPPSPSCLGSAGQDVWILPQSESDLTNGLLWLGWNAEALDFDDVVGDQVTLKLTGASPPAGGVFCGYTKNLGVVTKYFDTSDGFSAADSAIIPVDQHKHLNWAFTKSGNWTLTFELSGTPEGGSLQTVTRTYNFVVNSTC